jgi:hypothetical protein
MTQPIPDKAEVALEYPDKLYIGTFERTARFGAHLDATGISLMLERSGAPDVRKAIRMHFHYGLFAEILRELAKTANSVGLDDIAHRDDLREAAKALWQALDGDLEQTARTTGKLNSLSSANAREADVLKMGLEEEVSLLHVME